MSKRETKIVIALEHSPIQVGDKIVFEPIHTRKPHKLTLADVNEKVEKLYVIVAELSNKVDKLADIMNKHIIEQEKFNQYVLDVFARNNLK